MDSRTPPLSFTTDGLLPPGDYELTVAELRESLLVRGVIEAKNSTWDTAWRAKLVDNLSIMVGDLHAVGIREIWINGSFVEQKDHPNDIDGYFPCDLAYLASGRLEEDLNKINPRGIWTWDPTSRRPHRGYPKLQLPMWHAYRVELYPHVGQLTGIRDRHGHELEFPSAFRQSRFDGAAKGIVKLIGDAR